MNNFIISVGIAALRNEKIYWINPCKIKYNNFTVLAIFEGFFLLNFHQSTNNMTKHTKFRLWRFIQPNQDEIEVYNRVGPDI